MSIWQDGEWTGQGGRYRGRRRGNLLLSLSMVPLPSYCYSQNWSGYPNNGDESNCKHTFFCLHDVINPARVFIACEKSRLTTGRIRTPEKDILS